MARKNFYDILRASSFNTSAEYDRLHELFYDGIEGHNAIETIIEENYDDLPAHLRGRTISLEDFNRTYKCSFPINLYAKQNSDQSPEDILITFCEYAYNFCDALSPIVLLPSISDESKTIMVFKKRVLDCMDEMGMQLVKCDDVYIFVAKDPGVIAVAETIKPELAVSIFEYHHHSLKGNLAKKKAILKLMADDIEDKKIRNSIKSINATLESQLYQLLNKFVRHDHSQTPEITSMSNDELESWYDDIYQMWLLAHLELKHLERKERAAKWLNQVNN